MVSLLKRSVIEAEDWLRYHPTVRGLLGRYKWWRDAAPPPQDHQARARSVRDLCAAARLVRSPSALRQIHDRIRERVAALDPGQVDWSEFHPVGTVPWMPHSAVLKPCLGPREPGVLFSVFEFEWLKLLRHCDLREFARRYTLVLAPSSSPYNLVNYVFPAAYKAPLFSLINHAEDLEIIPRIGPNYRMVPLYTSHWVNPALYHPQPRAERDIDLIMVAAFGKVKRHHALFRAIRKMPRSLRILLIGQNQEGRTADTIRAEARHYGVEDRFELLSNAPHEQVIEALGRARVSVLLSRREGSAVVVAESLFADTPTALLHDAYNGSRAFINEHTGRFLYDRALDAQLMNFLDGAERFSARRWAEENISCHRSSAQLNEILRRHALAAEQEWTRDIAPLCWRPYPRLVDPEDERRLEGERRSLRERFGLIVSPDRP
jgi:glycosyltransferase involved in cell wall biosynthesis